MVTYDSTPNQFICGDNITWSENTMGYDLAIFNFGYGFLSQDGVLSNTVTQNGSDHGYPSFLLSSLDSGKWVPKTYYWQFYAFDTTNGLARTTIARGETIVIPDYSQTQAESQTFRTYKAICDMLEERANDDIQSTSINGKSIVSMPTSQLMDMRTYYSGLIKEEENLRRTQAGKKSRRTIRTRFNPVGGRGWWGSDGSNKGGGL